MRCEHRGGAAGVRAGWHAGPRVDTALGPVCASRSLCWDLRVLPAQSLGLSRQGHSRAGEGQQGGAEPDGLGLVFRGHRSRARLGSVTKEQAPPGTAGMGRTGLVCTGQPHCPRCCPHPGASPAGDGSGVPAPGESSLGLGLLLGLGFWRPCCSCQTVPETGCPFVAAGSGAFGRTDGVWVGVWEGLGQTAFPGWPSASPTFSSSFRVRLCD